jgi:major membrane immunogen (membrane-anchored lipoprotein)
VDIQSHSSRSSAHAPTRSRKQICAGFFVLAVALISFSSFVVTGASSTSTTTTVKDGRKITTKVKIDNDGTTTTTVSTKDKDGTVTTTTTVTDKAGNIVSTDDPEARARAEMAKKEREDKQAALASAPKRGRYDPIEVVLFQTVASEDLRKATTKEGVFAYLRKEFDGDSVIRPLDQARVDRYHKDYDFRTGQSRSFSSFERGASFLPADVYVESFAKMEDKVGISRTTKKLASAPYLVYTARIVSEYGDRSVDVTEEGHILANVEVTRKFAEKIKAALLQEIGPGIPKEAALFRRGSAGMAGEQINAADALRNLFKRK